MIDLRMGGCLEVLPALESGSVDAVVTDPPYNLGFMGRSWDRGSIAFRPEFWAGVLRVLKPGACLVAFGGTRTYHRLVCAIEDAGFEIRDSIACFGWQFHALAWVQAQGFPKGLDVARSIDSRVCPLPGRHYWAEASLPGNGLAKPGDHVCAFSPEGDPWRGFDVALKPAHEPIVLARKPPDGTVAENVMRHGCGGLNVDACRVSAPDGVPRFSHRGNSSLNVFGDGLNGSNRTGEMDATTGRWPPNLVLTHHPDCVPCAALGLMNDDAWKPMATADRRPWLDESGSEAVQAWSCIDGCPVAELDRQSGERPGDRIGRKPRSNRLDAWRSMEGRADRPETTVTEGFVDSGGASRFFPAFGWTEADFAPFLYCPKASRADRGVGNTHPTVKPIALTRWLVRLVTPPGGRLLDPFAGSGTTGLAAVAEGFDAVLIEREPEYHAIARRRIDAAQAAASPA